MRTFEERSTIETQCPKCMHKLNDSCRGDYEGCVTFKPRKRRRPSAPKTVEAKQLIETTRPGSTLRTKHVIEFVRLRCPFCGAKGPLASSPEKALTLAGKEGWNIYLSCCKACNNKIKRELEEERDMLVA